jgi:gliding motility-associated protein GldL
MAQSRSKKKLFHIMYSVGAAIVIIGALFKLNHYSFGIFNGSNVLAIGLITEAIVFFLSAFENVEEDLDWSRVYPELSGGAAAERGDTQSMLSQKLDDMLKEAKLDAGLMQSLGEGIKNFKGAAENIAPAVDSIAATNKYSEQLSLAAAQMESLNSLYQVQLESASRQAEINAESVDNAGKLKDQMESLASNLSSLNGVYGGMLTAMNKN